MIKISQETALFPENSAGLFRNPCGVVPDTADFTLLPRSRTYRSTRHISSVHPKTGLTEPSGCVTIRRASRRRHSRFFLPSGLSAPAFIPTVYEKISSAGICRVTGVSESWLRNYVNEKYGSVPGKVSVSNKKKPPHCTMR